MALHLVGETIDRKLAHERAQAGELMQIMRGIYVDADDDIEGTLLGHAVRISKYLYPQAYLSSASALALGPGADGRLFISGRRNQRTRLRSLEIVQVLAPDKPSLVSATASDPLGGFTIDLSSPRQRFLEAFRLRSEQASAITEPQRLEMAARLLEEYGSPEAVADALWPLARANGWYREAENAERWLLTRPVSISLQENPAALRLIVAWHGLPIGRLTHDGSEWRWAPEDQAGPILIRQAAPGKLPAFIASLLPEGWLEQVLHERNERDTLQHGKRYLSNISVVETLSELGAIPPDVLRADLGSFTDAGFFTGTYAGPEPGQHQDTFVRNLASLFDASKTPRLSGVQVKAPMCLLPDGRLVAAIELPFTHILKPAGAAGFELLPVVEWICLELGRLAGFQVPAAALVPLRDGLPPALLVERFDIRRSVDDRRMLALEDFCSVLDLPTSAKYDGTIERVARGLRPLSTDPAADVETLLRRALFAWFVADGDMHLKNLALLKIATPGSDRFTSVRLAPLYDAVTTRVFPGLAGDRMALKLNGRDDRLGPGDFSTLARTIGLSAASARRAISDLTERLRSAGPSIVLPRCAYTFPGADAVLDSILDLVESHTERFS